MATKPRAYLGSQSSLLTSFSQQPPARCVRMVQHISSVNFSVVVFPHLLAITYTHLPHFRVPQPFETTSPVIDFTIYHPLALSVMPTRQPRDVARHEPQTPG